MIVIPSIDLRGGQCVRLLKGEFGAETRYAIDPRDLLARYADHGVRWLHVVDLDGARDGTPGNHALIRELAAMGRLSIQLGGGLRHRAAIDQALCLRRGARGHRQRGGGEPGAAARGAGGVRAAAHMPRHRCARGRGRRAPRAHPRLGERSSRCRCGSCWRASPTRR
ncbi:MAG: HisA/HisF-related TIM barrel protein [Steroidobacteraceae bacterium]